MAESKKRIRSVNFSIQEKEILLQIILNFKQIIENKKTDMINNKKKEAAWTEITKLFNARSPNCSLRSAEALKRYYDNIKKKTRQDVASEKMECIKTGGGTKTIITDQCQNLALNIMNPKSVIGLENAFDDDGGAIFMINTDGTLVTANKHGQNHVEESDVEADVLPDAINVEENLNVDWGDWTAANMNNTPVNDKLRTKRQKELKKTTWSKRRRPNLPENEQNPYENYTNLAKLKMDFITCQKTAFEENDIKTKEILELMKTNITLDIEIKKEQLKRIKLLNGES